MSENFKNDDVINLVNQLTAQGAGQQSPLLTNFVAKYRSIFEQSILHERTREYFVYQTFGSPSIRGDLSFNESHVLNVQNSIAARVSDLVQPFQASYFKGPDDINVKVTSLLILVSFGVIDIVLRVPITKPHSECMLNDGQARIEIVTDEIIDHTDIDVYGRPLLTISSAFQRLEVRVSARFIITWNSYFNAITVTVADQEITTTGVATMSSNMRAIIFKEGIENIAIKGYAATVITKTERTDSVVKVR